MTLNMPHEEMRRTRPAVRTAPLVTITWTGAWANTVRIPQNPEPPEGDWRVRGACRNEDPELFFPVGNGPQARVQTADAKAVCGTCPVRRECLNWALETGQDDGVLGGLSEDERRMLHRRRSRQYKAGSTSSAALIVQYRRAEYEELASLGLPAFEVARRLGTNVQTVNRVAGILAGDVKVASVGQRPSLEKVLSRWSEVEELRSAGLSTPEIAERLGVGKNAVYDALKLKEAQQAAGAAEVAA